MHELADEIRTPRLLLRCMGSTALSATVDGDCARVAHALRLRVPEAWLEAQWLAAARLEQERRVPSYRPWSLRAIALSETREMVGHLNCHDAPENGCIELGYEIFAQHRRRGYALEAVTAFMLHAARAGVRHVFLAISPDNVASLAMAARLGAEKVCSQVDAIDGVEDVYRVRMSPLVPC